MALYSKKTVPLDVLLDRAKLVEQGTALPDIAVLRLPAVAKDTVFLHFGEGGDAVDLLEGMALHLTPPEMGGLFITSTVAQAGQSVKLLVGYLAE